MSGFELNKFTGAILLSLLLVLVIGKITDIFYHPKEPTVRGYEIAIDESVMEGTLPATEEIEVIDLVALFNSADSSQGKKLLKKCTACHSFENGGPNKVGPNLYNIVGKAIAASPDYNYSSALKAQSGKWSNEALFHFLNKPKKAVPGTKMSFAGIRKHSDIVNLISYLKQTY